MFLFNLHGIFSSARQANEHVLAQVKSDVVPTATFDGSDRDVRPLGKLSSDEAAHEHGVYRRRRYAQIIATPHQLKSSKTKLTGPPPPGVRHGARVGLSVR